MFLHDSGIEGQLLHCVTFDLLFSSRGTDIDYSSSKIRGHA